MNQNIQPPVGESLIEWNEVLWETDKNTSQEHEAKKKEVINQYELNDLFMIGMNWWDRQIKRAP